MKIITDRNTYEVKWKRVGCTYAEPSVKVKTKIFFGLFTRWKEVWTEPTKRTWDVEIMGFSDMKIWFAEAVGQYEAYQDAWRNASNTIDLRTKPDPASTPEPTRELRIGKDGVYEAPATEGWP